MASKNGALPSEDGWIEVNHRKNSGASSSRNSKLPAQPIAKSGIFKIYNLPKGYGSIESAQKLVSSASSAGKETEKLFKQVCFHEPLRLLLILRGVPGSGKSYLASALLAVSKKGVICSADDYFYDRNGRYIFNKNFLQEAHLSCQIKSRDAMKNNTPLIIVDNTNTRRFEMEKYIEYGITYGYTIRIFEPENSWKNDTKLLAQKNTHCVTRAKINQMLERFEKINPSELVQSVQLSIKPSASTTKRCDSISYPSSQLRPYHRPRHFVEPHPASRYFEFLECVFTYPMNFPEALFDRLFDPPWDDDREMLKAKLDQFLNFSNDWNEVPRGRDHQPKTLRAYAEEAKEEQRKFSEYVDSIQKYFPTCSNEDVQACAKLHPDKDECFLKLMDLGYEMFEPVEDPVVKEVSEVVVTNPILSSNVDFPALCGTSEKEPSKKSGKENGPVSRRNRASSFDSGVFERPVSPNDGEDWVDVDLPNDFVAKLNLKYTDDETGANFDGKVENPGRIRIPPDLAFNIFLKFHSNVENHQKS